MLSREYLTECGAKAPDQARGSGRSTEQTAVDKYGARQVTEAPSVGGLAPLSVARPAKDRFPAQSDEEMDGHTRSVPPACLTYVPVPRQIGRPVSDCGKPRVEGPSGGP